MTAQVQSEPRTSTAKIPLPAPTATTCILIGYMTIIITVGFSPGILIGFCPSVLASDEFIVTGIV